jgi:hypothetical protein
MPTGLFASVLFFALLDWIAVYRDRPYSARNGTRLLLCELLSAVFYSVSPILSWLWTASAPPSLTAICGS